MIKNFLKALVAGENLSEALAHARLLDTDVYSVVVEKQIEIIETFHNYQTDAHDQNLSRRLVMGPLMEDLMAFLMQEFANGPITTDPKNKAFQQVQELFDRRDFIDTLDEDALKKLLLVVVPVAVMRNLLARQRIQFDPSTTPSWRVFVDKYADAILAA